LVVDSRNSSGGSLTCGSITQKKKSVSGCSTSNRFSLDANRRQPAIIPSTGTSPVVQAVGRSGGTAV
jgi:hypothetical protein